MVVYTIHINGRNIQSGILLTILYEENFYVASISLVLFIKIRNLIITMIVSRFNIQINIAKHTQYIYKRFL